VASLVLDSKSTGIMVIIAKFASLSLIYLLLIKTSELSGNILDFDEHQDIEVEKTFSIFYRS
jgi:hypothetical protein